MGWNKAIKVIMNMNALGNETRFLGQIRKTELYSPYYMQKKYIEIYKEHLHTVTQLEKKLNLAE